MSATERATFAGRWRQAVASAGDRPFLVWQDPNEHVATWTYAEFDRLVAGVAGRLQRSGVRPGSSVHLALANSPVFVATWLAVAQLGAWIVPSDPKATKAELTGHIARTKPVVGLCARPRSEPYKDAASGGPEVLVVDELDTELESVVSEPVRWEEIDQPAPTDRAAVMFTSGTTAAPKGVVITQANYAFAGDVMAAAAALRRDDRQLVVLPLFHANAQYYSFAPAIAVGASVALIYGFSASGFLTHAAQHRATHASLFAAPMRMILARAEPPHERVGLEHCWYAQNITRQQYEEISRLFGGCRPRQLYGMTETIPAVLTNRPLAPIADSMGIPTIGCQVDLFAPESDDRVAAGDVGEVAVAGVPGITLFAEYLDDAETTAASFRNRWFRTGDLARRDDHGNFYFQGRRSDVLKVAGENVSVVEVEAVLAEHPSVLEAAVVAEPDPIRDEVPVAYVVQQPGQLSIDLNVLNDWCEEHLSPVKRPRRIEIVDELPRTSVGKIRKFLLRRDVQPAYSQGKEAE
jgi:carnitine-CoA ligase